METLATFTTLFMLISAVVFIVGGYQAYFWPQKATIERCRVGRETWIDKRIPFVPESVWIYSLLYYPFMVSPIAFVSSAVEFVWICISFFGLLFFHVIISYCIPIKTPPHYRKYDPEASISHRFLALVQKIDKGGNCLPSMHVAVATLTTLHLFRFEETHGVFSVALILSCLASISLSSVLTKQHFFNDIPWGAILAIVFFQFFSLVLPLSTFSDFSAWVGF